jgi:hypothetical protein
MQPSETEKKEQEESNGIATLIPDAMVAHNMNDLRQMYEHHNSLKGYTPKDMLEETKNEP